MNFSRNKLIALLAVCLAARIAASFLPRETTGASSSRFAGLMVEMSGVEVSEVYGSEEINLADDEPVIGVVVNGQARAYSKSELERPETHVIYDAIGDSHYAIAHCDLSEQTRAWCGTPEETRDIRVGGWDGEQMVLLFGQERVAMNSKKVALPDIPLTETTWGDWKLQYPESKIFLGNGLRIVGEEFRVN